jgi:hypothetical protein
MMATEKKVKVREKIVEFNLPPKRCPIGDDLLGGDCQEERCAWWVDNKCATVSIAVSLKIIAGKGVKE